MLIMKRNILINIKMAGRVFLACAAIGGLCAGFASTALAQEPSDMTPALQKVVKFAKGGMSDDFILSYITNSASSFNLSDDDIIYLHKQGVSDSVIKTLMQTGASATPAPQPAASTTPATTTASGPVPPPLDSSSNPTPVAAPAPVATAAPAMAPAPAPVVMPAQTPLQDNFFSDPGLNSALWLTQSGTLSALASIYGPQIIPQLDFSPSGMQMSGIRASPDFMGIQSAQSFTAPFTFSATVVGQEQYAIPFEIYLVSPDLQQYLSIAGHLGGRGGPRGALEIGGGFHHLFGDVRVPLGGRSEDYGIWINHTGSGFPLHSLGYRAFPEPLAGVPYTIQVSAGADGAASVAILNPAGVVLAAQNVPIGTGPFYVVLAGRDGRTLATWQSVSLTPTAPAPVAVAAPVAAPEVPATPTLDYFQAQLTPYGTWENLPGYGLCWQPAVAPGWRPYYDGGSWTYTDAGWYWQSDYPWGDIAFHYGRWAYTTAGWVWVPGYDYAPAWVVWRHADEDGYLGWAPLPPGAVLVDGGWRYNGVVVGADFDFGLGMDFFTFVPCDHFWEHDFRHWIVPHDRVAFFYHRAVIESHFRVDHGVIINVGIGRDRIAVLTHRDVRDIHVAEIHAIRHDEEIHHAEIRRDDIHDFHPGGHPDARGFHDDHGPAHDDHVAPHGAPPAGNFHGAPQPSGGHSSQPSGGQSNGRGGNGDDKDKDHNH